MIKLIIMLDGWHVFPKNVFRWMSLVPICDELTLVQLMAWCLQATNPQKVRMVMSFRMDRWTDGRLGGRIEWWQYPLTPIATEDKNAFRWMSLVYTYDELTLVEVMAWCPQRTSHCLSQCWPRSLPPYDVTRSQWVKPLIWYQSDAQVLVTFMFTIIIMLMIIQTNTTK